MDQTAPTNPLATRDTDLPGHPWVVHADAYPVVIKMRANGCSYGTIAATLGFHRQTLRELLEKDIELKAAMDEGEASLETELAGILLERARSGCLTSSIYLTKSMLGWRDSTPMQSNDKAPTVNISIPAPMTPEQLVAMTAQMKVISADADDEPAAPTRSKRIDR